MRESGTLAEIIDHYLDSSRCALLESYKDANSSPKNLTLVDMGGVFFILASFVAVSLLSWLVRRSPPAKKAWKWFCARRKSRHCDRLEADKVLRTYVTKVLCGAVSYTFGQRSFCKLVRVRAL